MIDEVLICHFTLNPKIFKIVTNEAHFIHISILINKR